jgi:hypothetical protein
VCVCVCVCYVLACISVFTPVEEAAVVFEMAMGLPHCDTHGYINSLSLELTL